MASRRYRQWWISSWPLASLCLLVSSRWLLESARPEIASTSLTQSAGCLFVAVLLRLLIYLQPQRTRSTRGGRALWSLYLAGAATFTGPALASIVSPRHINGENGTLALALTPVVVAVASSVLGNTAGEDFTARLWPGLAGIAGLLLLLPQPMLSDWRLDAALVLMPVIAGVAAATVTRELAVVGNRQPHVHPPWMGVSLGLSALTFGGLAARGYLQGMRFEFSIAAALLDGLVAWLSLTTLARLSAVRWSGQFLLIPLLTLWQGIFLLRPVLDLRSWSAFALLLASAGYLLVTGSMDRDEPNVFMSEVMARNEGDARSQP